MFCNFWVKLIKKENKFLKKKRKKEKEFPRVASPSNFGKNNWIPQYRTGSFSTMQLALLPPQQFPPLIFFSTLAIFPSTISLSYTFPRPFLKFLSTFPSSVPQLYFRSLIAYIAIPLVPTKNSFRYLSNSANSSYNKRPVSGRILQGLTLFLSLIASLKDRQA